MRPKIACNMLKSKTLNTKIQLRRRKKAILIQMTKRKLNLIPSGLISLALICLMPQILNLMVKCSSRRTSIIMMGKSILSKESGSMVSLMESALLILRIVEVFSHLYMEKKMVALDGAKLNKMEQDTLGNTMIMMNVKVFIESIIVISNNAMLLVLMNELLHLDG
jgi:hypothetical protein